MPTQFTGMGMDTMDLAMSKDIFYGLTITVALFVVFLWYLFRGDKEPIKPGEKWVFIFGGLGLVIFFIDAFLQLIKGVLI